MSINKSLKVIIVAPFWGNSQHLGSYRIERFIRWLRSKNASIILIKAGTQDKIENSSWGLEITIRDPLGRYGKVDKNGVYTNTQLRSYTNITLLKNIAKFIFIPDATVVWAKKVANHPLVLKYGKECSLILSSSPPESSHIASSLLAKHCQAALIVDMRDGWLDEPLKPLLQTFFIRRWQEEKLESQIINQASCIFVTSPVWKQLLEKRFPDLKSRISVLTNGYAPDFLQMQNSVNVHLSSSEKITLLYAGRFTGSRFDRKVSLLLDPLLKSLDIDTPKGNIVIIGDLEPQELKELQEWKEKFDIKGWSLTVKPSIPRKEIFEQIRNANGLLLLSNRLASIPSKLFEYLPAKRPILALTPKSSALWEVCKDIPQVFLSDYSNKSVNCKTIQDFLLVSAQEKYLNYEIPQRFTEEELSKIFYKSLESLNEFV